MPSIEDKIWDAITDSAKARIDYVTFKSSFPTDERNRELIADNLIWKVINSMQINNTKEVIADALFNDLLIAGFKVDRVWLANFIEDKDETFKIEIGVSKLATDMLNNGVSPDIVYTYVIKKFQ